MLIVAAPIGYRETIPDGRDVAIQRAVLDTWRRRDEHACAFHNDLMRSLMQTISIRRDTKAWTMQVWISFFSAVTLCAIGLANLPGDDLARAFMVMGCVFCLSTAFALAKFVRDNQQRRTRLGARATQAYIAFDDHPSHKRFSDRIETVTVNSVFACLSRGGLGAAPIAIR